MAKIVFDSSSSNSREQREFSIGNGLGGYTSLSIVGSNERKHHALLIASMVPPVQRMVLVRNLIERVQIGSHLETLQAQDGICPASLRSFQLEGTAQFRFEHESFNLIKEIAPAYQQQAVAVKYTIQTNEKPVDLIWTPWLAHQDHGDVRAKKDLALSYHIHDNTLEVLDSETVVVSMRISDGRFSERDHQFVDQIRYPKDEATGDMRQDSAWTPIDVTLSIPARTEKVVTILFWIGPEIHDDVPTILQKRQARRTMLKQKNPLRFSHPWLEEDWERMLYASDQFIVKRQSTKEMTVLAGYPWFTDWGRDTMISFEGLFLVTGRFQEAKSVLRSFAKYLKNGLIPNMFPDENSAPLYNTVDASLWYVEAVWKYRQATHDQAFVQGEMLPVVEQILNHYRKGTDFSISMDQDGLIRAGSGLDQVTWMDVRVNGEVITPRHGKPVEINALWWNALKILIELRKALGLDVSFQTKLARQVRHSFLKRFVRANGWLRDVVDQNDDAIRPNQIYALTLSFPILRGMKAKRMLRKFEHELVDLYGVRTLSPHDSRFIPKYEGDIVSRDHAYHMGTSWGFLMGTFLVAVLKTCSKPKAEKKVIHHLERIRATYDEGCIDGYAEVFDGKDGLISKGCYNQAWSVAEILRVYAMLGRGASR